MKVPAKEFLILCLLKQDEFLTATQMIELADGDLPSGTAFTLCQRMERNRVLSSTQIPRKTGMPIRVYSLTKKGIALHALYRQMRDFECQYKTSTL